MFNVDFLQGGEEEDPPLHELLPLSPDLLLILVQRAELWLHGSAANVVAKRVGKKCLAEGLGSPAALTLSVEPRLSDAARVTGLLLLGQRWAESLLLRQGLRCRPSAPPLGSHRGCVSPSSYQDNYP